MQFKGQFECFKSLCEEDRVKDVEGAAAGNSKKNEIKGGRSQAKVSQLAAAADLLPTLNVVVEESD